MRWKNIFCKLCIVVLITLHATPMHVNATSQNEIAIDKHAERIDAIEIEEFDLTTRTATNRSLDLSSDALTDSSTEQVAECIYPDNYIPPISPYVVYDPDGRNQVTDTTVFPYRAICYLEVKWPNEGTTRGTGVVISNRTILTAAHCVYSNKYGGYATKITVYPGRNGSLIPYGPYSMYYSESASNITLPFEAWKTQGGMKNDVALVKFNAKIGSTTGVMGFGNYSDSTLLSTKLRVAGYPSDKPDITLWKHARKINSVTNTLLRYNIDAATGQSGAPVYMISNNQIVGVHHGGNETQNFARRIDSVLFQILQKARQEDQ